MKNFFLKVGKKRQKRTKRYVQGDFRTFLEQILLKIHYISTIYGKINRIQAEAKWKVFNFTLDASIRACSMGLWSFFVLNHKTTCFLITKNFSFQIDFRYFWEIFPEFWFQHQLDNENGFKHWPGLLLTRIKLTNQLHN